MSNTTPLDDYKKAQTSTVIPAIVNASIATMSGTGRDGDVTSDVYHRKAKSFLFEGDMLFSATAAQFNLNTQHTLIQSKNYNLKTFDTQVSCVNSWSRAQNILVNQAAYSYNYFEQENRNASPLYLNQSEKAYHYTDYLKVQVGQTSTLIPSLDKYGKLEFGSTNGMLFETKGMLSLKSALPLSLLSQQALKLGGSSLSMSSSGGGLVKSNGELTFGTTGPLILSSDSVISLNTTGVMYLDASVILIGSSGFFKGEVDLDASVVESVADLVGFSGISDISSLGSGITSQITSALGVFSPGNLQNYISSAVEDNILGNVLGGAIGAQLGGYGDFINSLVPAGVFPSLLPFTSPSFVFDTLPEISPLEGYPSTKVGKPTSSSAVGGVSIPSTTIKEERNV